MAFVVCLKHRGVAGEGKALWMFPLWPGVCADGLVNDIGLPDLCRSAPSREIHADVPECENIAEEGCP